MSSTLDSPNSITVIQQLKEDIDRACKRDYYLHDWNTPDSWEKLKNDLSMHMDEWMKYLDVDNTISGDINKSKLPDRVIVGILQMCEGFEHITSINDLRNTISEIYFDPTKGLSVKFKDPIHYVTIDIDLTDKDNGGWNEQK